MAAVAGTSLPAVARRIPAGHRVLGLASLGLAGAHLLILALVPHSAAWSAALLVMTAWCAKCSWCVLRGGSAGTLMAMCALMGVAHVVMVIGMPWFAGHHAAHAHAGGHPAALMLLVAAAEFALMLGAALVIRARYRESAAPTA